MSDDAAVNMHFLIALQIRANARLLGANLKAGERVRHHFHSHPNAYLVLASGRIDVDGERMGPLDGVAISDTAAIEISASEDSELVMVEAG